MGKMRSPNFPTIPLGQAIDLVGKIFREDRQNAIDKEVAAKHMGYTGLTGRTMKLMGALSQYGLIDKVAKGQIRVSKNAVSILHWSEEGEKREAIAKAGTSPSLFRRIRDSFDDPSERTITSFLIKEGFTDSAIPAVLRSYRETNRFLADAGVSESYGQGAPADADSSSDFDEEDEAMMEQPIKDVAGRRDEAPADKGKLRLNFDLRSVSVAGTTTSPAELKEFVGQLTALQELFERFADPAADLV
ncbi:MAG: hypothetical protein JO276_00335 [Sphingomonadaceae bacterium]|nr:hypothetical protein [Sphingomonadaceae bacterium]